MRTDRERALVAAEDALTSEKIDNILATLALAAQKSRISPAQASPPPDDTVVVCGPKSAPVGAALLDVDPRIGMVERQGRWWIVDRRTEQLHGSPSDEPGSPSVDLAYIGRHVLDGQVIVHVAGLPAIGSLGAVVYLERELSDLFREYGDKSFSLVVRCVYHGLDITETELALGPLRW